MGNSLYVNLTPIMTEDNTNLFIFDSNIENLSEKSQQAFLEYF